MNHLNYQDWQTLVSALGNLHSDFEPQTLPERALSADNAGQNRCRHCDASPHQPAHRTQTRRVYLYKTRRRNAHSSDAQSDGNFTLAKIHSSKLAKLVLIVLKLKLLN